jgi:hypothetical protein
MGIFYETAPCLNRTPVDLTVTFDGQCKTLPAGATIHLPKVAIQFAKNQNPVMGSQDPNNPHITGGRYLVADLSADDTMDNEHSPMSPEEWEAHLGEPQRINSQEAFEEKYGGDPKAKLVKQGKARTISAGSKAQAGGNPPLHNVVSFDHDPR